MVVIKRRTCGKHRVSQRICLDREHRETLARIRHLCRGRGRLRAESVDHRPREGSGLRHVPSAHADPCTPRRAPGPRRTWRPGQEWNRAGCQNRRRANAAPPLRETSDAVNRVPVRGAGDHDRGRGRGRLRAASITGRHRRVFLGLIQLQNRSRFRSSPTATPRSGSRRRFSRHRSFCRCSALSLGTARAVRTGHLPAYPRPRNAPGQCSYWVNGI